MNTCRHGHPWTAASTHWITTGKTPCRKCKTCHAKRQRLQYRNDDQYREKEKQRYKAFYRAKTASLGRGAQACEQVQTEPQHDLGPAV
jgi:hypothetical protein